MKPFTIDTEPESEIAHLWYLTLQGDRNSFQHLLNLTYNLMFQYGHKFTHDTEMVRDAIQDVFLEVLEKRETLSSDIPPKPYLLASLRRRLHRLGQRQRWLIPGEPVAETIEFDIEFSVEHQFIQSELSRNTADQMAALMQELPKRQKEVVYLRFFQDLDRDEIAYMMDIQPQSVSNLLQTAFKWLRVQWRPVISVVPWLFLE